MWRLPLYWTLHSQWGIVFPSGIVRAVSHQLPPPFNTGRSSSEHGPYCNLLTITFIKSTLRNICWTSPSLEGHEDSLQLLWTPPLNQEAIISFCFHKHYFASLNVHKTWMTIWRWLALTLGVVANPDEIAINQPQRNQSLLPRDSCRSLRVVFPLHPVSVPVMDLSTLRWIRNKSSIVLLGAFSASCCIFNQPPWEVVGLALALELSPDPFKGSVNENPLPWGFAPSKRMVELMVGKWSDSNQIMLQ